MESAVASNPGPRPPNHAANMIAQMNNETNGAVSMKLSMERPATSAARTDSAATPWPTSAGGVDHHRGRDFDILPLLPIFPFLRAISWKKGGVCRHACQCRRNLRQSRFHRIDAFPSSAEVFSN